MNNSIAIEKKTKAVMKNEVQEEMISKVKKKTLKKY